MWFSWSLLFESYRVFGLDVYLISPDDPILLVIRGRLPVDHHCAGVEGLGRHLKRLSGHWSSQNLGSVKKKTDHCPPKLGVKPSNLSPKMHYFNDFPIIFWRKYIWYLAGVTPFACEGLETPVSSLVQNKQWFTIWPPLTLFFWPILTKERSQIVQQKGNILNQNAKNSHS